LCRKGLIDPESQPFPRSRRHSGNHGAGPGGAARLNGGQSAGQTQPRGFATADPSPKALLRRAKGNPGSSSKNAVSPALNAFVVTGGPIQVSAMPSQPSHLNRISHRAVSLGSKAGRGFIKKMKPFSEENGFM
jgi:hypothetical protein